MWVWWTANSGNNPKFSWGRSSRPWNPPAPAKNFVDFFSFFSLLLIRTQLQGVKKKEKKESFYGEETTSTWKNCIKSVKFIDFHYKEHTHTPWLSPGLRENSQWQITAVSIYLFIVRSFDGGITGHRSLRNRQINLKHLVLHRFKKKRKMKNWLQKIIRGFAVSRKIFFSFFCWCVIWHLTNCSGFHGWMSVSIRSARRAAVYPYSPACGISPSAQP